MKSEFRLGHGLQTWFFRALGYLGTCSVRIDQADSASGSRDENKPRKKGRGLCRSRGAP